jgi:molybdate transport system ATP-binding protein
MLATHRASDRPVGVTHVARLDKGRLVTSEVVSAGRRGATTSARPGTRERTRSGPAGPAGLGAPLIAIEGASVYREQRLVIEGLDWRILAGEHWCVTGANGTGKSTLMLLLYGDLWPALGGRVARAGCAPGVAIEDWKHDTGLVSPELQASYAATGCTLEKIVVSGLHSSIGLNEWPLPAELALARRWLKRVGLAGHGARRARQVSYGQLRLALLARALVRPRRLLLLDEPFDGLDPRSRAIVTREVGAAVKRGAQVVLATHHDEDVPAFVRHRLELRAGGAWILRAAQGPSLRTRRVRARRGADSSSSAAATGVTVT